MNKNHSFFVSDEEKSSVTKALGVNVILLFITNNITK
jgi:hypothetical protein